MAFINLFQHSSKISFKTMKYDENILSSIDMQIVNCQANSCKSALFLHSESAFKGGQFVACERTLRKAQGDPERVGFAELARVTCLSAAVPHLISISKRVTVMLRVTVRRGANTGKVSVTQCWRSDWWRERMSSWRGYRGWQRLCFPLWCLFSPTNSQEHACSHVKKWTVKGLGISSRQIKAAVQSGNFNFE